MTDFVMQILAEILKVANKKIVYRKLRLYTMFSVCCDVTTLRGGGGGGGGGFTLHQNRLRIHPSVACFKH